MVFERDQERLSCFKVITLGTGHLQAEKAFVSGGFQHPGLLHKLPGSLFPSMLIPCPHMQPPAHCSIAQRPLQQPPHRRGRQGKGTDPLEELRNAGAFLLLAPSPSGLAQSGDTLPLTKNVPGAFFHLVMPSTKVLSLGIPPFI